MVSVFFFFSVSCTGKVMSLFGKGFVGFPAIWALGIPRQSRPLPSFSLTVYVLLTIVSFSRIQ